MEEPNKHNMTGLEPVIAEGVALDLVEITGTRPVMTLPAFTHAFLMFQKNGGALRMPETFSRKPVGT
jgi:hypothetical protein